MSVRLFQLSIAVVLISVATIAQAVSVPTSENFNVDAANWADNSGLALLSHVPSGGPDGSAYASTSFTFNTGGGAGGTSAVLFRAQDEFNSSGNAFVGDWISDKISKLTVQVRHDAPLPLSFFSRFSGPGNHPGGTAIQFAPVPPNLWTTLTFNISPASPQFVTFEGTNFNSVFSNVGHIQLGVSIPETLADDMTAYSYDLDNVIVTPEPTAMCLAALALGWMAIGRRRSR